MNPGVVLEAVRVENLPVVQNHLIERARREEGAHRPLADLAMNPPEILGTQANQEIFVSAQEWGGIEKQPGQQSGAGAHISHYGGMAETTMPDEDIEQFRRIAGGSGGSRRCGHRSGQWRVT